MTEPPDAHAAASLPRLLRLAWPVRGRVLAAAVAGALASSCAVALLAVSGFLIARASRHPGIAALSVAVVAVRGLSVGRGVFRYAERLASHDAAFRVLASIRVAIWRRLESLAPAGLPAYHGGDLLARLVGDVDATRDLLIRGVSPVLTAALAGCGAVIGCVSMIGRAGLLLAAGLLAGGVAVPLICLTHARAAAARTGPARGRLSVAVADMVAGAGDLTAFVAERTALARAVAASSELTRLARHTSTARALSAGLSSLAAGLTVWGVLLAGSVAAGSGSAGRVPLAVATLTALAAFEVVSALPAAAIAFSQARAGSDRIMAVMDAPDPVADPPHPAPAPTGPVTVSLRAASLRYAPGAPLAIDGVSLELTPGRRVALVGPNGAGKSTVAAVLLRFRELDRGSATMTDRSVTRDLACYRARDVRKLIGGCPQDPHLFTASIAANLRIGCPDATAADLADAIERVGLGQWVASLPDGLGTQLAENGAAVSGGQRQRIALARALLADPSVLILDEPTAHLDPPARRALMTDVLSATRGRSVLLITHDLDGLDQVDEIVVLDRGQVVERGTHSRLLALGGRYRRMTDAAVPCPELPRHLVRLSLT